MKKRIFSVLLAAAMVMGTLAGCGSGDSASGDDSSSSDSGKTKIRMTYWNSEDTMAAMLDYLAEAVPDVEVEFQFIDNDNYATIVDTQLSADEGPDIICESPADAVKHAQLGYLEPLDELGAKYSESGTSAYTVDNTVYALPGISWFEGVFYNVDLFEQNNIELPKTFDEFIAVCKQFQDLGITPLAAGLKSWEPMAKNSLALVTAEYLSTDEGKSFGADYRDGKATMDGTFNEYLEKWTEMIDAGIYTSDMLGIDHDQSLEEFATGNAAMFCSGPWDLGAIQEKNPDLNLGMMPFNGTTESDGWLIGGPGCGFALNAKSENKEAAMKVLEAITTEEGQLAMWENNQGGSSFMTGVSVELPEVYNGVSKTLEVGNVYCPWNEWGAAGASIAEEYGKQLQSYLMGEQDLSTTLQNVDATAQELFSK